MSPPAASRCRWAWIFVVTVVVVWLGMSLDNDHHQHNNKIQSSLLVVQAFSVAPPLMRVNSRSVIANNIRCWQSSPKKNEPDEQDEDVLVERTSFDQAGRSLIEEEDQKRMEQMGDFDSNPNVRCRNDLCGVCLFVGSQQCVCGFWQRFTLTRPSRFACVYFVCRRSIHLGYYS